MFDFDNQHLFSSSSYTGKPMEPPVPPQLPDDSTESARVPALIGINSSEPVESTSAGGDEPNVMVIVHEATTTAVDDSEMVSQSAPGSPSLQDAPTTEQHHQSEYTDEGNMEFGSEPKDSGRSEMAPEFSAGAPDYSVQVSFIHQFVQPIFL